MGRLIRIAFMVSVPVFAAPSDDASTLLQRVASAYANVRDYVIDVDYWNYGAALGVQPRDRGSTQRITIARSGDKFAFRWRDGGRDLIWNTDGLQELQYRADLKEYILKPAAPWPAMQGPGPGLPGIEWSYFARFRAIGGAIPNISAYRGTMKPDRTCPFPTAVVEIQLSEGKNPVKERLRVDAGTALICTMSSERVMEVRTSKHMQWREFHWTYRRTSGPVDEELFTCDPPGKAKAVDRFHEIHQLGSVGGPI